MKSSRKTVRTAGTNSWLKNVLRYAEPRCHLAHYPLKSKYINIFLTLTDWPSSQFPENWTSENLEIRSCSFSALMSYTHHISNWEWLLINCLIRNIDMLPLCSNHKRFLQRNRSRSLGSEFHEKTIFLFSSRVRGPWCITFLQLVLFYSVWMLLLLEVIEHFWILLGQNLLYILVFLHGEIL